MEEWYSLSEASRKMGKERGYVSAWIRNHPEVMPKEMLRKVGDANLTLISDSGIDVIKSTPRKKESVQVRNNGSHMDYLEGLVPGVTLMNSILNGGVPKFYCFDAI